MLQASALKVQLSTAVFLAVSSTLHIIRYSRKCPVASFSTLFDSIHRRYIGYVFSTRNPWSMNDIQDSDWQLLKNIDAIYYLPAAIVCIWAISLASSYFGDNNQ
jgi:hypothetical protein